MELTMVHSIHYPAVAGMFYPASAKELRSMVEKFLRQAQAHADLPVPKAIIAPHAGYVYSGSVAASAYACLQQAKAKISRVVILAPAHRYPVNGIVATAFDYYATPLGNVPIDKALAENLAAKSAVQIIEKAYSAEHSIEVHLPFLQVLLGDFSLVPLLVGQAQVTQVVDVLREIWGGEETLVVVSSDLSHYHDYAAAQILDRRTADAILALNPAAISDEQACGYAAMRGLLTLAAEKSLQATMVDLCNSGDTSGIKDTVVGYGAFHFGG
jgi:AmmeMemoRadiSam system protein B